VASSLIEKTLMDITDTSGIAAGVTKNYDASGQYQNVSYMTANTVSSSSTNGAYGAEVTSMEIVPPQDADGNYEDLRHVWLVLDSKPIQHYIYVSGYGWTLMTPFRTQLIGGPTMRIQFGVPLWVAIQRSMSNMPVRAICPKYTRTLGVSVMSQYGVSSVANGGTGFRVIVRGVSYDDATLAYFASSWNPNISLQTYLRAVAGKPAVNLVHTNKGPLSISSFTSYPGGQGQGALKVNPYWHSATNGVATSQGKAFGMTNLNDLGGGNSHVSDEFDDLGLEFKSVANVFLVNGFGVRGVPLPPGQGGANNTAGAYTGGTPGLNLSRAGWNLSGALLPTEEGGDAGIFVSEGLDTLAFGAAEPYMDAPNRFLPVPLLPGEMLVAGDNATPFIAGDNGAIPQDQVAVAINGVLIEQV